MQVKSPVDLRSSAELDRMDALLRATGITTPITMPSSPAVHLDPYITTYHTGGTHQAGLQILTGSSTQTSTAHYQRHYEEIQGRPVHAGTDPNQHFRFGSSQNLPTHHNYQTHQTHYSWSTPPVSPTMEPATQMIWMIRSPAILYLTL
ncbi:hypothetical protein Pst134EB_014327 [Puccinia striiformis f. sp. tritici]|nr:hypothetical protein Pst134EB_014327 [Puccinia striiformis f. sp. tritici]